MFCENNYKNQNDQNDSLFTPFNNRMARLEVLLRAGVVSPTQLATVPIAVMNISEHPVKLYAGTRIGELFPVKTEDRTPSVNEISSEQLSSPMLTKRAQLQLILSSVKGGQTEKRGLKQLLNGYRDVFANNENEVGLANRTQFKINTKSKVPMAATGTYTIHLVAEVDKQGHGTMGYYRAVNFALFISQAVST